MAWGSNITDVRFNMPVTEFDPATWQAIGQRKREEDKKTKATLSVAEARKNIRDKFQTDRENKAYTQTKESIQAQLTKAEAELAEINKQLTEAIQQEKIQNTMVAGPNDSPTNSMMQRSPAMVNTSKGFGDQTPTRNYRPDYSEMPIFPVKGNR